MTETNAKSLKMHPLKQQCQELPLRVLTWGYDTCTQLANKHSKNIYFKLFSDKHLELHQIFSKKCLDKRAMKYPVFGGTSINGLVAYEDSDGTLKNTRTTM